jgi:hypothetical protein
VSPNFQVIGTADVPEPSLASRCREVIAGLPEGRAILLRFENGYDLYLTRSRLLGEAQRIFGPGALHTQRDGYGRDDGGVYLLVWKETYKVSLSQPLEIKEICNPRSAPTVSDCFQGG